MQMHKIQEVQKASPSPLQEANTIIKFLCIFQRYVLITETVIIMVIAANT